MAKRPTIDVVVVVRDGYDALAECLARLREHGGYHRLILVDDASTDLRVRKSINDAGPNCLVLRNEQPIGYAASVNRGLAASRHAVAIVPASAIVTRDWLQRLSLCAESARDIGTVTPLTTQLLGVTTELDADAVALAVELGSVPIYPQLTSPPGPVMLVRRELVAAIGLLDPGLDEHDALRDFGVRAAAAGFRNVACDDAHVANASSPRSTPEDPAVAPIGAMVRTQLNVLAHVDKPAVLHVVHPRGGGTEKYIRELIAVTTDRYRHYFLRIHNDRWAITEVDERGPAYELFARDVAAHPAWLRSMCAWLRIGLVHVHSLVGSGADLVAAITATALPYCYSVHDMYLPCPTVYLIDSSGEYCNATTDAAVCRRCLAAFPRLDQDIERWRDRYATFLAGAVRVYAPSRWAADTLLRYYPGLAVTIAPPHEEAQRRSAVRDSSNVVVHAGAPRRSVGLLGAIGPEKGARNIEALVTRIRERGLPLRLVVIGYTDTLTRFQSEDGVLMVHGAYARDEIEALLDAYRIDLLLFPTVWPETFSYTLSEGWMAGRPALVPPRGALAERVHATGAGWIIDGWPHIDAMLDHMVTLTSPAHRQDLERRMALARSVFAGDARGTEQTPDPYRDLLDETRSPAEQEAARYEVYVSACRALGVSAHAPTKTSQAASPPTAVHRLMRMLRG